MKLLQELLREADEIKKAAESEPTEDTPTEEPTEEETPVEKPEEETPDDSAEDEPEEETEDVGAIAEEEGFEKSSDNLYAFGKTRKVTLLTKDETLGGMDLTLQYVINPSTGAWSFRACLSGQSLADMVEFSTGEDPSSLAKHLRKKKKITPHQAVEYLHPPANKQDVEESVKKNF